MNRRRQLIAMHDYSSDYNSPPNFSYNFLTSSSLDASITFARPNVGTYTDVNGVLQTAAVNTPRFDFDPVIHAPLGLLMENTRTNLVTNSSDISQFTATAVTYTTAAGVAPDGTNAMVRVVDTTASAVHYINKNQTVVASTVYAYSMFLKAQQYQYAQVFYDDGVNGCYANFDLVGGIITVPITARGSGTAVYASIAPAGNGVYRCTVVGSSGSTVGRAGAVLINSPTAPFAPSFAGTGTNGLLAWGAQLEAGSYATSYIPTLAATVTRNADTAYKAVGAWYSVPYSVFIYYDMSQNSGNIVRCGIGDTNFNNAVYIAGTGLAVIGYTGASMGGPTLISFGANKESFVVDTTVLKYNSNSNSVIIGTAGGILASRPATRLSIGCSPWALANTVDGHVKMLTFWNRILSDYEMMSMDSAA